MTSDEISQRAVHVRPWLALLLFFSYWITLASATHWPSIIIKVVPKVVQHDYLLHAAAFFVLGWLLMMMVHSYPLLARQNNKVILLTLFFYCTFDESMQVFFPPRHVAWTDAAANIFGAAVGIAGYRYLHCGWNSWCAQRKSA